MSDKQETIADIIAEMREKSAEYDRLCREHQDFKEQILLRDWWHNNVVTFRTIADRLEAAHRRELAAGGDAAALREALQAFVRAYEEPIELDNIEATALAYDQANAALVEPPRNCDRFATVEDARKAHEAICEKYSKCHNGCPLNNEEHYSAFDCFEAWLFAPVADREGGNDGN